MKYKIGVMGSAQGPTIENQENIKKAIEVGHCIAKADAILVTGACPGLPDEAAFGAHRAGGFVLGISPAFSEREHIENYKSPQSYYDTIIYTGMGLMERDIVNIRSSDAVIFIGGGIGTLNEFTVAYDEGKVIGILEGTEGISSHFRKILDMCNRDVTAKMIFESDPQQLIEKITEAIRVQPHPTFEDERVLSGHGK